MINTKWYYSKYSKSRGLTIPVLMRCSKWTPCWPLHSSAHLLVCADNFLTQASSMLAAKSFMISAASRPSILVVSVKFARWFHNLIEVHPQHAWYTLQGDCLRKFTLRTSCVVQVIVHVACFGILRNGRILGTHIGWLGKSLILNALWTSPPPRPHLTLTPRPLMIDELA